jgi:type II secretory pathway pseudopilin PulG
VSEKGGPVKPWYETQVVLLLVGFVRGIVASFAGHWWQQSLEKSSRAESLKVAFRGEINAIRSALAADARAAFAAWQTKTAIKDHKLTYPRKIYDSHTGSIGDLRESVLVGHISQLYSTLDRAQDVGRRIENGTYAGDGLRDFAMLLAIALNQAVILDMRLTEQTKHLVQLDWSVKVSGQDAADRNFAVEAIKALGHGK